MNYVNTFQTLDNSEEFFLWHYHLFQSFTAAHRCEIKPEHLSYLLYFTIIELILTK